jgi:succinoglycan biosynthesis transport protein ExoP
MSAGRMRGELAEPVRHDSPRLASLQEMYRPPAREHSISDYWHILLKRKWIVIVSVAIILITTALISLHTTPIYEAVAKITISPPTSNPLNFKDNNSSSAALEDPQAGINTQVKILQSDTMAELVIHRMNLDTRADFAGPAQTQSNGGIAVSQSPAEESFRLESLIRKLQGNLTIQQIPDTTLVQIGYSDPSPALAAEIANGITAAYIEQNVKSRYDSTMQAADWLSKQLADMQIKMQTAQAKLVQYQKEHAIVGTDDKQNLTTEKLDELNRELTSAQADRIQKESLYNVAKRGDPSTLSVILQDPILSALRQRQSELQTRYAQLDTWAGQSYPQMREITSQLDQLNKSINEQVKNSVSRIHNDYQTAVNREQMLQEALGEQMGIADQLNQNAIEYKVLKQEADSNRQIYDGLLQQLKEASLAAGLTSSNTRVVDRARLPRYPTKPNIPRSLEFALLVGLVVGIALAFGLEALDATVRTPEQAEATSGLPVLGVIPMQPVFDKAGTNAARSRLLNKMPGTGTGPQPLISYLEPRSEIAEAYRALRTSILLSSVSHPPRSILVTSSVPEDGKTMTSINIAIVMAQQEKRILLVDADMRRPSVHTAFKIKGHVGLSNVLTGGAKVRDAIQSTVQPNLFVLPAGLVPPHPSELLSSSLMRDLLKKWCEEYDHVIIDSPPVITVTDAVLLSVETDAVLLIIRSGQTTAAHVRHTCGLLHSVNADVLGVVVNAADLGSPDYYHYGGRSGYYAANKMKSQEMKPSEARDLDQSPESEHDETLHTSS